jgi:hypothetical protein
VESGVLSMSIVAALQLGPVTGREARWGSFDPSGPGDSGVASEDRRVVFLFYFVWLQTDLCPIGAYRGCWCDRFVVNFMVLCGLY